MKKARLWISILLLFSLLLPAFFHADAARIAVIKGVKGEVYIKKGGGKREFKAKDGMSLSQGDSVRTEGKASANITYDDGSKTTVGSNSKLIVSKLANKNAGKQTKVKVLSGKVWNSVQNLSNANDEYNVETPTAVMGVRGTHFLVSTDPITNKSSVTVLEGLVGVSQNGDHESNIPSNEITQTEQLVAINQTLDTQTLLAPIPEAKALDVKELIQQVEPEVIVEMIQDLTETIKETQEQVITTQLQFKQTKQQELITKALELSKVASAITNIQENVLKEINQSPIKTEVSQILNTKFNQTIENVIKQNTELKMETEKMQQEVTTTAIASGMTKEQVSSIGPSAPTTTSQSQSPSQSTQSTGTSGGGGGTSGSGNDTANDDDDDNATPISPIGTPIPIEKGKLITFEGGVSLNLNNVLLPVGTTVTAIEKVLTEQSPELYGKGLKLAGKVIDFNFVGGTVNQPVEIKLPIQKGADLTKAGIFYLKNDGNWEYIQSTTSYSTIKATVNHFSTYGVLEAEKATQPKAAIAGATIEHNSTNIVDEGTAVSLFSEYPDATIYYTMGGTGTKQVYHSTNKPTIGSGKVTLSAYSERDNMLNSPESTFTFIARPSAPNVTADDKLDILIGMDETMEYSTDNGQSWISYVSTNLPIFKDDITVQIRVKANGEIPEGKITTIRFSKNNIPPQLTLKGDNPLHLKFGALYVEPGVIATDDMDGDISEIKIDSSLIDTLKPGSYTVTYKAKDTAGNESTATRTVIVEEDKVAPVITLLGENTVHLFVGNPYIELGATAIDDIDGEIPKITIDNSIVDTSKVGSYTVTYNVTDRAGNKATATRTVIVEEDKIAPIITLLGENTIHLFVGDVYTELGATAIDNVDGEIATIKIDSSTIDTLKAGTYTITYTATDKAGNIARATRTVVVKVKDTVAPVIALQGSSLISLFVGNSYSELGATAIDDVDGVITNITITGSVNPLVTGSYTITYSATDKAGNVATATRIIVIEEKPVIPVPVDIMPPVITLNGSDPLTLFVGDQYNEPGAIAIDNMDGEIANITIENSSVNTSVPGFYGVIYKATDKAGNVGIATRTVVVEALDTTAPTFNMQDVIVTSGSTPDSIIVIPFNEDIVSNVGTGLKDHIQISCDGSYFHELGPNDIAEIGTAPDHKNRLIIQLEYPITGGTTKVKILGNTLKDESGNVQLLPLITDSLVGTQYSVAVTVNTGSTPIPGATVIIDGKAITTDARGIASFTLSSGGYSINVYATGYNQGVGTIWVDSNGNSTTITLYPIASEISFDTISTTNGLNDGEINLNIDLNKAGTVYYVVLPSGATAPSVSQVIAGHDSNGTTAYQYGSFVISDPTNPMTKGINGLISNAFYDIYVVATDTSSNAQATVTKLPNVKYSNVVGFPLSTISNGNSNDSISLTWGSVTGASVYEVYVNNYKEVAITGTQFTILNLNPNTPYTIRVDAFDQYHNLVARSEIPRTTDSLPTLSNISLDIGSTSTGITWDSFSGATSYSYSINGATPIVTTTPDVIIVDLQPNQPYSVVIKALNGTTEIASSTRGFTTLYELNVDSILPTSILLSWTYPGATNYKVFKNGVYVSTTSVGLYTINDLLTTTDYNIMVEAWNATTLLAKAQKSVTT